MRTAKIFRPRYLFGVLLILITASFLVVTSATQAQFDTGLVPLYWLSAPQGDQFYTISKQEQEQAAGNGYITRGTLCWVAERYQKGTVPLYKLYLHGKDHYYTTSWEEIKRAQDNGYKMLGVACHIADRQMQGTVPLHKMYNNRNHVYLIDEAQIPIHRNAGYDYIGIAGYVWPENMKVW